MDKTIEYYNQNADMFAQGTHLVDFMVVQERFAKMLPVIRKMCDALKDNGVIYTSFKYGDFEGERNGRYFTDFTEDIFDKFIKVIPEFMIEEAWITSDMRPGRREENGSI